jgi:hypothetical protein
MYVEKLQPNRTFEKSAHGRNLFFWDSPSEICQFSATLTKAGLPDGIFSNRIFWKALEWKILVRIMGIWYF